MTKADFIICAPLHLAFKSNGVRALAQLARSLEQAGRNAYICAYTQVNGRETAFAVDFDTYMPKTDAEREFAIAVQQAQREFGVRMLKDFSPQRIDACYVVYPEVMLHNVLNAKRVVRYFQNKAGSRNGIKVVVGPGDFILAHSRMMHPAPHHVCFFAHVDPVFHNGNTVPAEQRTLDLTYVGEGSPNDMRDTVPQTVAVTRTWPPTKEQLATLLRSCRFFYTASACSSLNVEALACGAIPAFLGDELWTREEIDGFEPGPLPRLYEGIQTGDNFYTEFETARIAYFERLHACDAEWDESVARMIEKVDMHFAAPVARPVNALNGAAESRGTASGASPGKHEARIPVQFGIPEAPSSAHTVFGEKAGERAFYPYRRKATYAQNANITTWIAARLVAPPYGNNPGLAIQNQMEQPVKFEEFTLPAKQLVLVTYPGETMAARVSLAEEGVFGVVAEFTSQTSASHIAFAAICVNGTTIWRQEIRSASSLTHAEYLNLPAGSMIDFAVEIDGAASSRATEVGLKFGVVEYDSSTNRPVRRRDDNCSMIDTERVAQWLAATPFAPRDVASQRIALDERADLLHRHWTLDKRYLESQFARSPRDVVQNALEQAGQDPAIRYAICLTPRSGSTLLTEILSATGKLGYPIEYFVPDAIRCLSLSLSDAFASYEALITEGFQSPNGVFGVEIEAERFFQERAFFSNLRNWRVVYMTRRDLLAQAISFARSIASGTWHSFGDADANQEKPLDRNTIVETVNFLLRQERTFEKVFKDDGVEVLCITYEELVAEPAASADRIARYIGISGLDFSSVDIGATKLQPTRRGINRHYERAAVMHGGTFNGYHIHKIAEDRYAAIMAGVDPNLLPLHEERMPVLFMAKSREELHSRLATYIALLLRHETDVRAPAIAN